MRYKEAEHIMYRYPLNIMRLMERLKELKVLRSMTDYRGQVWEEGKVQDGTHGDPVARYSDRIMELERQIRLLRRDIDPISSVRSRLKASEKEHERVMFFVLELHYFEGWRLSDVAFHLCRSRRWLLRLKHALVQEVMRESDKSDKHSE